MCSSEGPCHPPHVHMLCHPQGPAWMPFLHEAHDKSLALTPAVVTRSSPVSPQSLGSYLPLPSYFLPSPSHLSFRPLVRGTKPQIHVTVLLHQKQKIPFCVLMNTMIQHILQTIFSAFGRTPSGSWGPGMRKPHTGNTVLFYVIFFLRDCCSLH